LVGARGEFPDFVIPTNEYMQFAHLTYILMNAKCVIDLPTVIDYESSMLALTEALGTPVVTTNWSAMGRNSMLFLVSEKTNGANLPARDALISAVQDACKMNPKQMDRAEYNDAEMVRFKKMFRA
jgi:hypothetical protein